MQSLEIGMKAKNGVSYYELAKTLEIDENNKLNQTMFVNWYLQHFYNDDFEKLNAKETIVHDFPYSSKELEHWILNEPALKNKAHLNNRGVKAYLEWKELKEAREASNNAILIAIVTLIISTIIGVVNI